MLGGDFNVISSLDEYVGLSTPNLEAIDYLHVFLSQASLHELPVTGGVYTWTGVRRGGRVWKKLDRLLFNAAWLSSFSGCSVEVLSRATSDHSPLVLKASFKMHSGPRRFRFQNMWIKRPDFLDVVKRSWSESQQGYGMYLFSCKLRN